MNNPLRLLASICALALAVVLSACGGGAAGVAGKYEADGGKGTLVLQDDHTFTMDTAKGQHVTGTWQLDGSKLTMSGGGTGAIAMTITGTRSGNELSLQFGPVTTVFRRK